MDTVTAREAGQLLLAPALSGDVSHHELSGETLYVQSTSFPASDPSVDIDTEFGGTRTFFGGEGPVCEFSVEGRVWTQTRSPDHVLALLVPQLPSRNTSGN